VILRTRRRLLVLVGAAALTGVVLTNVSQGQSPPTGELLHTCPSGLALSTNYLPSTGYSTAEEAIQVAVQEVASAIEPVPASDFVPVESVPPSVTYAAGENEITLVENAGTFYVTKSLLCAREDG
jgi:hypothetical protein